MVYIKHNDRIDRQMVELLFFNATTTKQREKNLTSINLLKDQRFKNQYSFSITRYERKGRCQYVPKSILSFTLYHLLKRHGHWHTFIEFMTYKYCKIFLFILHNTDFWNPKGHCSLKVSRAFFRFFVFLILSYQNACYGCENAENRTWSDFFLWRTKFRRQCVDVIDTWGWIYFLTCNHFGLFIFIKFLSSFK